MLKFVPEPMKALLRPLRDQYRNWRVNQQHVEMPASGIHLHFAGMIGPENKVIFGGAVKLLPLAKAFPGSAECFNVLYLVSSVYSPTHFGWIQLAKRIGAKIVLNQNGVGYPAWAPKEYTVINDRNRRLIEQSDYVIYQSQFSKECVAHWVGKFDKPACVLANPVDTNAFCPSVQALPDRPLVLLAAGTHQHAYRVATVLKALANLRQDGLDCCLHLAGQFHFDDPAESGFKKMLQEFGVAGHVVRIPPFTRSQAPEIFRKAHILIHPQYKDACPTVVLEALASGVPVIGTCRGGMPELVTPECGVLLDVPDTWDELPAFNLESLCSAVQKIAQRREFFSTAARRRAEQFNELSWVDAHARILSDVLVQKKP